MYGGVPLHIYGGVRTRYIPGVRIRVQKLKSKWSCWASVPVLFLLSLSTQLIQTVLAIFGGKRQLPLIMLPKIKLSNFCVTDDTSLPSQFD